jgi:hypothetical protein
MSRYTVSVLIGSGNITTDDFNANISLLQSMAYAETYLTIARIVRRFHMELHDTTAEDISIHHVRLVGYPKRKAGTSETYGQVKVRVTKENS